MRPRRMDTESFYYNFVFVMLTLQVLVNKLNFASSLDTEKVYKITANRADTDQFVSNINNTATTTIDNEASQGLTDSGSFLGNKTIEHSYKTISDSRKNKRQHHGENDNKHDQNADSEGGYNNTSKNKLDGDGKKGDGRSNRPTSNSVEGRMNRWVAGRSNCTCAREFTSLKRDLRNEIRQRVYLHKLLDSLADELNAMRSKITYDESLGKLELGQNTDPNDNGTRVYRENQYAIHKPRAVTFSAKLSYNRELQPLDTIVFDVILTNVGNGYNSDTGKFTAPVDGTYLFHATVLSGYDTKVETAIILNDKEIARVYSGARDAHGSGSNMAAMDMRSGDEVSIRLLYQGGNHVHGYYSTFTGTLLNSV